MNLILFTVIYCKTVQFATVNQIQFATVNQIQFATVNLNYSNLLATLCKKPLKCRTLLTNSFDFMHKLILKP